MTHVTEQICTKNMKTLACTYNIYNKYLHLHNTTKVILLTAVVMDIGFENVTGMSLSES